jgi:hypothetical protein
LAELQFQSVHEESREAKYTLASFIGDISSPVSGLAKLVEDLVIRDSGP